MALFEGMVAIGVIVKPQGRHGEVAVAPLSDRPDRFPSLRHAFLPGPAGQGRQVIVASARPHKGRFVVKIQGVDSIDDAELLRGQELRIPEAELEALPAGEYYHHQLLGLAVVDEKGAAVGEVKGILEAGPTPVLEIRSQKGELLVPLAEHFVLNVDLPGRRLTIALPETVEAR